jgi:chromosome segregation protein
MDQDRRQLKKLLGTLRGQHSALLAAHQELLKRQASVRTLRSAEQQQQHLTEQQLLRAVRSAQTLRVLLEAYKEHAREEVQREQEDAQDQLERARTKAAQRLNSEQKKHAQQRAEWQAQRLELEAQLSAERSLKSDLEERLSESERQRRRGDENGERLMQELAESVAERERAQESAQRSEEVLSSELDQVKSLLSEERERSLQMQREALGKVVVEKQNEELQRIAMQTQDQLKTSLKLQNFHQQQTEDAKQRALKEREQAMAELQRTRIARDKKLESVRLEVVRSESDWARTRARLQEQANTLRDGLAAKEKELLRERESAAAEMRIHEQAVTKLEGDLARLHSDVSQRDEKLAAARRTQEETQRALTDLRSTHTIALEENRKLGAQCTQLEKKLLDLDGRLTTCEKRRDQFRQQAVQAQKQTEVVSRTLQQTKSEVEKLKGRDPGEELKQQVAHLRNQNRALGQQMGELRTALSASAPEAVSSADATAAPSSATAAASTPVIALQALVPRPPAAGLPPLAPPPAPSGPAPSLGRAGGVSMASLQDELLSKKG